jgi:hypothetical protein
VKTPTMAKKNTNNLHALRLSELFVKKHQQWLKPKISFSIFQNIPEAGEAGRTYFTC